MTEIENPKMLTPQEAARELGVSACWLYRHKSELPHARVGRLIRFDSLLLRRHFQSKYPSRTGNRLRLEGRMAMLRRYQRGYIYKTGKRIKVWYGKWREDVLQSDGRFTRCRRNVRLGTVTELPTKFAAYEELSRRMAKLGTPFVEMSFRELTDRWIATIVPTIKPSSAVRYRTTLTVQLVPAFGNLKIAAIGRFDFEKFLAERAAKYCRNSLRAMRAAFSRVMGWAVDCSWIEKNPALGVKLPYAPERVVRTVLSPEQINAIMAKLEEPYATLVYFLAVTGLRVSEAAGLRWEDFDGEVLRVRRRVYDCKTDTLKTRASARDLPIPLSLLTRMRALGTRDWIFASRAGTPVNPGNALKRYVRPAVRELGIPLGGWHDFRHTLVTRLKHYPVKVVSGIVGHADVRTTLQTYQHIESADFRAPLDEIAAELVRSGPKPAMPN